ncbi:16S rRNA (guanine527-N7)-methyltransferase [Elusimicrobium simillimum]|uniref:16S rRNA (guanine(527)-N(7))-methyltransferase RsmG n=1 Tax=Elusimicrobium simillimum TaxID=3143438 RepID=UPI003C6F44C7
MQKINDFINFLNLNLTTEQMTTLEGYVDAVWQKKDDMNLTSVDSKTELWGRHIADGLQAAALIKSMGGEAKTIADLGSGAGFIGISVAVALPNAQVTLVESLEKRCKFMQWVVLKLGIKNVTILNIRAGQGEHEKYDFVLERAMGKLEDILDICLGYVKEDGYFIPFQSDAEAGEGYGGKAVKYTLPADQRERSLIVIHGHR